MWILAVFPHEMSFMTEGEKVYASTGDAGWCRVEPCARRLYSSFKSSSHLQFISFCLNHSGNCFLSFHFQFPYWLFS